MPPRKKEATERLDIEQQAYINPMTRASKFEVFLRPGCNQIVSISPASGLGDRHRLGYKRLMYDEIEMMDGDTMYPLEKDFGMYWFEPDANDFATTVSSDGEVHYILAMDKDKRDKKLEAERKYFEQKNDNVSDDEHARQLTKTLKRGSAFEAEEERHIEELDERI